MTDRIVFAVCGILLMVLVFSDQRVAAQGGLNQRTDGKVMPLQISVMSSAPASAPTINAAEPVGQDTLTGNYRATGLVPAAPLHATQLSTLMSGGCILWFDLDERHMMTCGDTLPAVKVVNLERRYMP